MSKEGLIINLGDREIFRKKTSSFGNSSHILISKKYLGRDIKILAGKIEIKDKEIKADFSDAELFNRKTTDFGTGCHIIIPKEYFEKEVFVIVEK